MSRPKPHDKNETDETIRGFLQQIGRKGGKKRARHPEARQLNRRAAEARWRKPIPEPKKV